MRVQQKKSCYSLHFSHAFHKISQIFSEERRITVLHLELLYMRTSPKLPTYRLYMPLQKVKAKSVITDQISEENCHGSTASVLDNLMLDDEKLFILR